MRHRRLLFDVGHPAHVHLFHPVIQAMREAGHGCFVSAREKDVTTRLLDHYGHEYRILAPLGRGLLGQLRELVRRDIAMIKMAKAESIDCIVGTSVNAARAAKYLGIESIVVNEDDVTAVPSWRYLGYPFASKIITPDCLKHEAWGNHHVTYPAIHELFYLHPKRFQPDRSVLSEMGLNDGEKFGIIRLSGLSAHHDLRAKGVSDDLLREIVALCAGKYRLFITSERTIAPEWESLRIQIPPERILHALGFASFIVGDSQTMVAEAAVLGCAAFRLNSFVGRLSYLTELEDNQLAFGFRPGNEAGLIAKLKQTLDEPHYELALQRRRDQWLARKIDPVPWFCDLLGIGSHASPNSECNSRSLAECES
jgi:predicted glycosyltransferase